MTKHPFSSLQQEEEEAAEGKGARSKIRWGAHRHLRTPCAPPAPLEDCISAALLTAP